jgi:surfactin synthase thioesterase subunit
MNAHSLVRIPQPKPGATARLYCFPHAGGWSGNYTPFVSVASGALEVALVEIPGRGTRAQDSPSPTVQALAEKLAEAIAPTLGAGPSPVFFGHSMGGIVAFEVHHCLMQRLGRGCDVLVASACHAPALVQHRIDTSLHQLSNERLVQRLKSLQGTPAAVLEDESFLSFFLPIYRHDLAALAGYRYRSGRPRLARVAVFGGGADADVPASSLQAWQEESDAPIELKLFPGGHFYLLENAAGFVASLEAGLDITEKGAAAEVQA